MFGLPPGTVAALLVVGALPVLAYGLYRLDVTWGDGRPAAFGRSSDET